MAPSGSALAGSALIVAAALVHLVLFAMESMLWSSPKVWRRFGLSSQRDADTVRPMAYNQGFYNLFLAGGAVVGLVLYWTTLRAGGVRLSSSSAASAWCWRRWCCSPPVARYRGAALLQGALPLAGLILFVVAESL